MLIGELARRTGLTKDTIRHYADLGLLTCTPRRAGSRQYQDFADENLERIETILLAKAMGFSLGEIAQLTEAYFSGRMSPDEVTLILRDQLVAIDERMAALTQTRALIEAKIAQYEAKAAARSGP